MWKFTSFFIFISIVVCYAQDGMLGPSFGDGGKVITNVSNYRSQEASSIAVQKDSKIAVSGWFRNSSGKDFVTLRFNADGELDSSYSNDGIAITDLS